MPDTFITKAIKKVVSDLSAIVNRPLDEIKRLSYNLDKAAKKSGVFSFPNLAKRRGGGSRIWVDPKPVHQSPKTTILSPQSS